MICAGGSGGKPLTGATTGSGGGGSGGVGRLLIPAQFLPDLVYIRVGQGGAALTSGGANGSAGINSYVALQPNTNNSSVLITGGTLNAGNRVQSGGAAGLAPTFGNQALFGISSAVAGAAGGAGGNSGAAGASVTYASSTGLVCLTGGGGSAGYDGVSANNGGSVANTNSYPFVTLPGVGANTTSANGYGAGRRIDPNNPQELGLLFFTGSPGGGASASAGVTGGSSGAVGYGCGSGAGGGGSAACGNVAAGGDGLVLISAW